MKHDLYQTLEDRGNIDEVEAEGPYPGDTHDRWLGEGYYYWDTFVNSAHFWGRMSYVKFGKDYIIAKSVVEIDARVVLDLLVPEGLNILAAWRDEFTRTFPISNVTVEKVITHAKNKLREHFPYKAIRAVFSDCINISEFQNRIKMNKNAYFDFKPPIQICLLDKKLIGKNNFKVIYPEEYNEECRTEESYVY